MSRPCNGYRFIAEATAANANGNTNINPAGQHRRNSLIAPATKSKKGSAIPNQRANGGTRFKGFTKISSKIPPALARVAKFGGKGDSDRNAKSQNTYIVVYGPRSACEVWYAMTKLVSHTAPIAVQTRARRTRLADERSANPHPATTNADENENQGARNARNAIRTARRVVTGVVRAS